MSQETAYEVQFCMAGAVDPKASQQLGHGMNTYETYVMCKRVNLEGNNNF